MTIPDQSLPPEEEQLPLFDLTPEQQPVLPEWAEEEPPVEEPGGILIERDKAIYP